MGKTALAYYNNGRLKTETGYFEPNDTGAQTITTQYDPAGQQTSVQDTTSGTTISATYYLDELERSANDGPRSQSYGYDGVGQLAARQDTSGSTNYATTYNYRDSESLASMVTAAENGGTTSWTYDAGGRAQTQTDPSGLQLTWNYNTDGSLGSETYGSTSTVNGGWRYGDNGAFQVTSMTFGTGTTPCSSSNTTYGYGYDAAGRVNSVSFLAHRIAGCVRPGTPDIVGGRSVCCACAADARVLRVE